MKTDPRWILALVTAAVVASPVYAQAGADVNTGNAPVVQLAPGTAATPTPVETRIHTSMNGPTVSVPLRRGVKVQEPIVSAPTSTASATPSEAGASAATSPQ